MDATHGFSDFHVTWVRHVCPGDADHDGSERDYYDVNKVSSADGSRTWDVTLLGATRCRNRAGPSR